MARLELNHFTPRGRSERYQTAKTFRATELTYDPNGNLTSISYPNTVTETVSYDNVNQISTITDAAGGTSLLSEAYVRNADSQVTGQNSASVAYTAIHQVASSGLSGAQLNYTYDRANRLTQITNGSNATSLGYNAGSQLTSVKAIGGTTTYGFNSEGDRTSVTPPSKAAVTYTYDQAGRLTGVTAAGLAAAYSYNGNGLRMSKTVNGMAEQFSWDQSGSLPLVIQDGSTNFIYGPGGITLEQLSGTTPEYFMHDWQGSTLGLASTNGAIAASYSFDAYGNLTASTGSASTPLLFQGQYLDSETGFYYLQARYYDPLTGQFMAPDPATAVTGAPYGLAAGDPVNGSDPSGLFPAGDNSGGGYVPQYSASAASSGPESPVTARFGVPSPGPSAASTRSTSNKSHSGCSGIFCGFTSFVSTVGAFALKHVGTIVSIAAIGTCIVGTLVLCAALTVAAFVACSAQRYAANGSHSFGADAVDAATTGASFGLLSVPAGIGGGTLSQVNGSLGLAYRTFVELPDMLQTGLFAAQANG